MVPARALFSPSRLLALVLCAAVAASMVTLSPRRRRLDDASPTASWRFSGVERCFMRGINRARARRELRRLRWDRQLGYVARRHARSIARRRTVAHDGDLGTEVTRWRRLGQNTGRGGSCRRLFRAFMGSSAHRANVLGRWRYVGVGAVRAGGRLYVQQVFEARRDPGNIYRYP